MGQNKISFLSLWLAQSTYRLGDTLYVLSVVTYLYTQTQSVLCATLFGFVKAITSLVSGFVAPLVMDRLPLRRVLISGQVGQVVGLFGLLYCLHYGEFHIYIVTLFVMMLAFLEGWSGPARNAMVPRIVEKKNLVRANSLIGTTDQIASCISFGLGGMCVAMLGTLNSLWISMALLVGAGLASFGIQDPIGGLAGKEKKKKAQSLKEVWSFVYKHPIYRRLFLIDAIEIIAGSVFIGAITLVFVKETLKQSEAWWGFLNGSLLLGTVVGGIVALALSNWLKKNMKLAFIISSVNQALMTLIFGVTFEPLVPLVLMFLIGIPVQVRDVALRTLFQTNADTKKVPHIFAAHQVIFNVSWTIGMVLMAAIAEYVGIQTAYMVSAGLVICAVGVAMTLPKTAQQD